MIFGMSTSINLSSNILEAAKVAAEKSDLTLDAYVEQAVRHALGRAGESTQASAPVELPAFDCGGGGCPILCVRGGWFTSSPRIGRGKPRLVG